MVKIENQCVDCGLPCMGKQCPYMNVETVICDSCGSQEGQYRINGKDYCESCAAEFLREDFESLSIPDRMEVLGLNYELYVK